VVGEVIVAVSLVASGLRFVLQGDGNGDGVPGLRDPAAC